MDELTHLLLDARDGDRDAFEQAVRLAHRDVFRYVAALAPSCDVEDVVQNTFVGAWRSLALYRAEAAGRTWLLAIARRACADAVRSSERRRRLHATFVALRPCVSTGDASTQVELEDLVQALPTDIRDAFVLTQLLGVPYAQTAQICDVPIGTIRSRVARARGALVARSAEATAS